MADVILPGVRLAEGRSDHEAFLAEIELRSTPRVDAGEAAAELTEGRAAAGAAGATRMAVGLHPDARYGDVRLVDSERYRRVGAEMRGLRNVPNSLCASIRPLADTASHGVRSTSSCAKTPGTVNE